MTSPLEAAKALANIDPKAYDVEGKLGCVYCGALFEVGHPPDCPWLAMPQIVAALEVMAQLCDYDNWWHLEPKTSEDLIQEGRLVLGIDYLDEDGMQMPVEGRELDA